MLSASRLGAERAVARLLVDYPGHNQMLRVERSLGNGSGPSHTPAIALTAAEALPKEVTMTVSFLEARHDAERVS